jgi:DNA replication protein DnaC
MASEDDLVERLRRIGLRTKADALGAFLTHAHKSRLGPTETFEQLLDLEERSRAAVNLARRTRSACLGAFKPLDRFDWSHPKEIDRELVERLLQLDFVEGGENVLLKGASGVGKTMIAQSLGHAALAAGYTVRFSSLATALADLISQESLPAFERRIRRYVRPDVLVLDELGYVPCDGRAADVLYNIVSRRHASRSTIITTNLAFKQWGNVFPGAACIAALIDRFNQHCHKLVIVADSWRETHPFDPDHETDSGARPAKRKKR